MAEDYAARMSKALALSQAQSATGYSITRSNPLGPPTVHGHSIQRRRYHHRQGLFFVPLGLQAHYSHVRTHSRVSTCNSGARRAELLLRQRNALVILDALQFARRRWSRLALTIAEVGCS